MGPTPPKYRFHELTGVIGSNRFLFERYDGSNKERVDQANLP